MKKVFLYSVIFVSLLTIAGGATAAVAKIENPLSAKNFCELLTKISIAVAGLVGAISVIMIIVAGIMYLLSAGNPDRINKAKTAFFYAIMGIVIALSAGAIVTIIKDVIK